MSGPGLQLPPGVTPGEAALDVVPPFLAVTGSVRTAALAAQDLPRTLGDDPGSSWGRGCPRSATESCALCLEPQPRAANPAAAPQPWGPAAASPRYLSLCAGGRGELEAAVSGGCADGGHGELVVLDGGWREMALDACSSTAAGQGAGVRQGMWLHQWLGLGVRQEQEPLEPSGT